MGPCAGSGQNGGMHLRPTLALACACGFAACVAPPPGAYHDPELIVRGTLELGEQQMTNEDFWRPTEEPFVIAGTFDVRQRESGFGGEIGASIAFEDSDLGSTGADAELSIFELWGGARETLSFAQDRLHPYVGAGVTLVTVAARVTQGGYYYDEEDDISFGLYARAGAYWSITPFFDVGLDLRSVFGTDVELAGVESDVDSTRLSLVFGWSN